MVGEILTYHRAVASVPNMSERDDLIVREKLFQGRKGYFISPIPTYRISHTMTFVPPFVGELAGTRNSSMGSPWRIDPKTDCRRSTTDLLLAPSKWKTKEVFYLRLYGVGHMVQDHSDSERGNPLPPLHGLLFSISSNIYFICTIPQTRHHIPRPLLHQSWSTGWKEK